MLRAVGYAGEGGTGEDDGGLKLVEESLRRTRRKEITEHVLDPIPRCAEAGGSLWVSTHGDDRRPGGVG
jgi:hypothetical protein